MYIHKIHSKNTVEYINANILLIRYHLSKRYKCEIPMRDQKELARFSTPILLQQQSPPNEIINAYITHKNHFRSMRYT